MGRRTDFLPWGTRNAIKESSRQVLNFGAGSHKNLRGMMRNKRETDGWETLGRERPRVVKRTQEEVRD